MYGFMDIHGSITGSNIQDISDKCDLLIAKKSQQIKGKQVVMAGVPECQLEKYIKKNTRVWIYVSGVYPKF